MALGIQDSGLIGKSLRYIFLWVNFKSIKIKIINYFAKAANAWLNDLLPKYKRVDVKTSILSGLKLSYSPSKWCNVKVKILLNIPKLVKKFILFNLLKKLVIM